MAFFRLLLRKRRFTKFEIFLAFTPLVVFITPIIVAFFDEILADWPEWILIPYCIIQTIFFFTGLYVLTGKLIMLPFSFIEYTMNKFEKTREWLRKSGSKRAVVKYDKSRRRFISASAAVISGYAVGSAGMGVLNKDDYEIIHKNIHLNNLPESLKGTTITLVSDIHSGPYMSEEVMKDYVDVINSLNSDLILIPGDMTSTDRNEVKPFTKAFRDLKAEHGIYATLGNHDYLTDPDYISDAISGETPIQMMRNDSSVIEKDGNELCILGMEDTKESMAKDYKVIYSYLDETIKSAKAKSNNYNELPKILLCHKPYFFKGMSRKGIDLILSGHTHGGQVVLVKFGKTNISLASTISNYISGYYSENGSQMYVSRGLGSSALPLRINCRPEITRITLT